MDKYIDLHGRKIIRSSEDRIDAYNVVDVLMRTLPIHQSNRNAIQYLQNYYRGIQPILHREKKVRPDVNNTIVQNHAYEIVMFKLGQLYGDPVQYVRRSAVNMRNAEGDDHAEEVSRDIQQLNEYCYLAGKAIVDKEVGELALISGSGYKAVYPNRDRMSPVPFTVVSLDPRDTYVVYESGMDRRPLMSVQTVYMDRGCERQCVYTDSEYFEIEQGRIVHQASHPMGVVPVIEYPINTARMGAFEPALPLLDAINNLVSDRLNAIDQFVQALVKFINCDVDEEVFKRIKEDMAVVVRSTDNKQADVQILSQELNQSQGQIVMDSLYQIALTICGVPNRNGPTTTSGDTGHAVIMRDGWADAEARTKDVIEMYEASERRFIEIILKILRNSRDVDIKLNPADVGVKFTRNKNENMLVKTQGLINQLNSGIAPHIAIATCGLYSDPEQVALDSAAYLERMWGKATRDEVMNNEVERAEMSELPPPISTTVRTRHDGNQVPQVRPTYDVQ